jgi:ketosteroid isomerase-like protein
VAAGNADLVRRSVERWSAGDLEGFVATLDPELEWRTSGLYPGLDPVYHGHDGFRKFWHDFHEIWETISMEIREVVETGDLVAFSFHFDAVGRDGVRTGRDQACVGWLRDGLLYRIQNYATWDEARAQLVSGAGRSE